MPPDMITTNMMSHTPTCSSSLDNARTFSSHQNLLAGIGAEFESDPVVSSAVVNFKESVTAFNLEDGVMSNDMNGLGELVIPKRDKLIRSRSGRKGVLTRKQREHAALVRRSGGACAQCRSRKVKVCTND